MTLKINAGNDKDSFNVVVHITLWKSIFDIKNYILEQNSKYKYDCQTIKYIGKVLSNKDITFEEMNSKSEMTFDILIEKLILQLIVNDKILVDEIWYNVSLLIEKK